MKYLTFGEIMLRLKSPGHECLFQNGTLEATFGGGRPMWLSPWPILVWMLPF